MRMFNHPLLNRLGAYGRLMRLHRPIPILLLLWPTLWAVWVAGNGHPPLWIVSIFVLGVLTMRSAGCIVNDIADRRFDGHVVRTKDRPLITGEVSLKEAFALFAGLCLLAFGLVCLLNIMTIAIAIVALIISSIYPFTKRLFHFPQVVLGVGWYLGILMAFSAQLEMLPVSAWLIYVAAIVWTVAYDTMYAMADREDDLKIGVKSAAVLLKDWDRAVIGGLQLLMLGVLVILGQWKAFNMAYYFALFVSLLFMGYQQFLIRGQEPKACINAFLNNHWVGLVIFMGIICG